MMVDSEIKIKGFEILSQHLGTVQAGRFIALIQRELFEYTKWRKNLFEGMTGEEISKNAMEFRKQQKK